MTATAATPCRLDADRDAIQVSQQKLVAADTRYYTISKMRSDAGIDTYLNVLVAQSSLFSAQLNLVTLQLSKRQNLITLYEALGGGWAEQSPTAG